MFGNCFKKYFFYFRKKKTCLKTRKRFSLFKNRKYGIFQRSSFNYFLKAILKNNYITM